MRNGNVISQYLYRNRLRSVALFLSILIGAQGTLWASWRMTRSIEWWSDRCDTMVIATVAESVAEAVPANSQILRSTGIRSYIRHRCVVRSWQKTENAKALTMA